MLGSPSSASRWAQVANAYSMVILQTCWRRTSQARCSLPSSRIEQCFQGSAAQSHHANRRGARPARRNPNRWERPLWQNVTDPQFRTGLPACQHGPAWTQHTEPWTPCVHHWQLHDKWRMPAACASCTGNRYYLLHVLCCNCMMYRPTTWSDCHAACTSLYA